MSDPVIGPTETAFICAIASVLCGLLLCLRGGGEFWARLAGVAYLVAGGFMLGLSVLDDLPAVGWIAFGGWIVATPVGGIAAGVLIAKAWRGRVAPWLPVVATVAALANGMMVREFWVAVGLGGV